MSTSTATTAKTNPSTFFAIASKLIPANVELTIKETYGGLDATDFAILRAIRDAIPAANQQQPSDVLRFVEEMSAREIGEVMGRSEGSVRVLIHRALRAVADELARARA